MGGSASPTDNQVGAHDVHLRAANNYSGRITCNQCHNVPATANVAGHMDSVAPADVPFAGSLARANSATPTWNSGTVTCSGTYCHFGKPYSGGGVTYPANNTAVWTNSGLLTGTPSLLGDCGKCHASPPAITGEHTGVNNINQCSGCHDHVTSSGTFSDPSKHINGVVDASSCSSCHGWPPTTGAHTVHINQIIIQESLGSLPGGFVGNRVCGTCHNVSALTKHLGSTGNDGTSRNIYLPTPSTLQATYQFGTNPVSYDKGNTTTCSNISCHLGQSTAWGDTPQLQCSACHGYPPVTTASDPDNKHVPGATAVNHIGTGPLVNTKTGFNNQHGGCQICHGIQGLNNLRTDTAFSAHANYNEATQHNTGSINMNGPTSALPANSTRYDASIGGCLSACHSSEAPYRMTFSGKTLAYGEYGAGGECVTCHAAVVSSPVAAGLPGGAAVTTRPDVVTPFTLASRHIRSRTPATTVRNEDCCVCHMEGDVATGGANGSYHKNGYIELRDPDLGTTIKGVTHNGTTSAPGTWSSTGADARPIRFSRNLSSAVIEADTAAIMINHCLKCHDTLGATNTRAQVPTTGSATKPFGATVAANPGGNVLDVTSQFASTNKSFHPVLVRQNNGYTGTRMVAPWNGVAKSATTTVYGPLISCWDCHAASGATGTITTSGSHGGTPTGTDAVVLRGRVYTSGTTAALNLCLVCHTQSGTTNHGTGSSFTSGTDGGMTYMANRCYFCHSYNVARTRPFGAGDAHGYNTRANGTAFPAVNNGYAFIRNEGWYGNATVHSIRSIGATTYTPTCGGVSNTTGGGCSRGSMGGYTPGGVY